MSASGDALRRGAELFDAGLQLEAHETWEEAWRDEPRGTARSKLLQGLAQCAAAALKQERGQLRGARSLAHKGAALIEQAIAAAPSQTDGLALFEFARDMRSMTDAMPRLTRKSTEC